jgi:hypothetical protein
MRPESIAREEAVFGLDFVEHFGGTRENEVKLWNEAVTNWEGGLLHSSHQEKLLTRDMQWNGIWNWYKSVKYRVFGEFMCILFLSVVQYLKNVRCLQTGVPKRAICLSFLPQQSRSNGEPR